MSILRTIVISADVGVFGWLIWLGTVEGLSSGGEWFFFLVLLLLIVVNLYFIATNKRGGDSWIGLFLKRKALEERKKIHQKQMEKMVGKGGNYKQGYTGRSSNKHLIVR